MRECADDRELLAEVSVQGLKSIEQGDDCLAILIGRDVAAFAASGLQRLTRQHAKVSQWFGDFGNRQTANSTAVQQKQDIGKRWEKRR